MMSQDYALRRMHYYQLLLQTEKENELELGLIKKMNNLHEYWLIEQEKSKQQVRIHEESSEEFKKLIEHQRYQIEQAKTTFDPLVFELMDDSDQCVAQSGVELGLLQAQVDEFYTQKHFVKFLGFFAETNRSLPVIAGIAEVSEC